jgi:hypothetical protein
VPIVSTQLFRRTASSRARLGGLTLTDEDVQELIGLVREAQLDRVNGTFNSLFDLSQGTTGVASNALAPNRPPDLHGFSFPSPS